MSEPPPKNSKGKRRSRLPWLQTKVAKVIAQEAECAPWLQASKTKREKAKAKITEKTNASNNTKAAIGQSAELAAEQWLSLQGLMLLERNFRCRGGEIDLIMADGKTAVVIEVRTRTNKSHGHAAETVYGLKQHRVGKAAKLWWAMHGCQYYAHLRFDVVAFDGDEPIKWFKNAWQFQI